MILTQCAPTFRCLGGGPHTPLASIVLIATVHAITGSSLFSQFNDSVAVYYISLPSHIKIRVRNLIVTLTYYFYFLSLFLQDRISQHISAQSSLFLSLQVISGVLCKWFAWIGLKRQYSLYIVSSTPQETN